jgi:hypothetical protein
MKRILYTLFVLVLVLAISIPLAAPVVASTSQTLTLFSNSSTATSGYTVTNPVSAPISDSSYGTTGNAVSVTTRPAGWAMLTGAMWISTTGTNSGNESGAGNGSSWRFFKKPVYIPPGATVTSATLEVAADNALAVYLNNNSTPFLVSGNDPNYVFGSATNPDPFFFSKSVVTQSFVPVTGENTLYFVVRNWNNGLSGSGNPTGLIYKVTVNYTLPTIIVRSRSFGGEPLPGVSIDWSKTFTAFPPNSGINNTPYPISNAGGVVRLTAPLTYASGGNLYAFFFWNLDNDDMDQFMRTVYFTPSHDMIAVAVYKQISNFVTGGGTIKDADGKKPLWTFAGNIGLVDTEIVGEFNIDNHDTKVSYHCDNLSYLIFTGPPADSPSATYRIATLTGNFTNNQGLPEVVLSIVIGDRSEGKSGNPDNVDWIHVKEGPITSAGPIWIPPMHLIDGGNFQVHN